MHLTHSRTSRFFSGESPEQQTTLLVVTHSEALAARFPRRLALEQGRFVEGA